MVGDWKKPKAPQNPGGNPAMAGFGIASHLLTTREAGHPFGIL